MAASTTYSTPNDFWIQKGAIRFELNALGDPDKVAVSLSAGAVIMAWKEGVIDYNAGHNYRTWVLSASPTHFDKQDKVYVYVRLSRIGDTAQVVYPYEKIAIEPEDGSDYYIMLGALTSSLNGDTPVNRAWAAGEELNTGVLDTDEQRREESSEELARMFILNNNVIWTQQDLSFIAGKRLLLLRMSVLGGSGNAEITHIATTDSIPSSGEFTGNDTSLITTAALERYADIVLGRRYFRKDEPDTDPHLATFGDVHVEAGLPNGEGTVSGGNVEVDGDATIHGEAVAEDTLHVKKKAIFGGNADEHTVKGDDLVAYSIYGAGYGWKIDRAGNMEVESLKVNSYLETNELRINRLQAQEGDTIYTDNDQIEEVEEIVDETEGTVLYRLTFKEKWEGYFTAQRYGNILKGIINTLAAAYIGALDNSSGSPVTFTAVDSPTGNPKEQGYYEYADGKYVPTGDLSVETGKTYYIVSAKGGYEEEDYSATLNPREVGLYERSGSTYFRSTDTEMDVTKTYYRKIQGEDSAGNKYFTSWMWVVGDRNTAPAMCGLNQVLVALWEDYDSLPQNKNFAPCVNMALGRWGCIDYSTPIDPEHDTPAEIAEKERLIADIKARQTFFYLSASEGRFMKLKDVAQPLLEEGNYGMVFGNTPDFIKTRADWEQLIEKHPHLKDRDYLFAQGLIYSDLVQLNIKGVPVVAVVDCGDWIDGSTAGTAIATGDDSALADEDDNITEYNPGDTIITPKVTKGIYFYRSWNVATCRFETHTVRHKNGKWMCLVDQPVITNGVKVYHEPKWNSVYWKLVEGNSDFSVDLESNRGTTFRIGYVNTTIIPTVFYGMVPITEDLSAEYFSWTRTVDTSEERSQAAIDADTAWNTLHQHVKNLALGNGDMPMDWGYDRRAIFECTVTIINGSETRTVTQQVIV